MKKVVKYSLYEVVHSEINSHEKLLESFSRLKFGSRRDIEAFGARISKKIVSSMGKSFDRKDVCVTSAPFCRNPSSSHFLTQFIADYLGCRYYRIRSKRTMKEVHYKKLKTKKERIEAAKRQGLYLEGKRRIKESHIIYVDDLFATGALGEVSYNFLKTKAKLASFFYEYSIINLRGPRPHLEYRISAYVLEQRGVMAFVKMLNDPRNVLTRFSVKCLVSFSDRDLMKIVNCLSEESLKRITNGIKEYQGNSDLYKKIREMNKR